MHDPTNTFFIKTLLLRAVLDPQQNWAESREIACLLPASPHAHSLPHCQPLLPQWYICRS